MMPSPRHRAVLAAAGARKTQTLVDEALSDPTKRVLIATYTRHNCAELEARVARQGGGLIPKNVTITTWYSFLLNEGIRPYQSYVFDQVGFIGGLNFLGDRSRYTPRAKVEDYFLDGKRDVYRDTLADLVCAADENSGGRVIRRLEGMFDRIMIDEVQDMVGHDLDLLDRLFASRIEVLLVGDPRQYIFSTSDTPRNKQFRGAGFSSWLHQRRDICVREDRHESYRCNQEICNFASALFPGEPPLVSLNRETTEHDGIFQIRESEVLEYVERWRPQVLRRDVREKALGLPAMNFGVSKGSTFDRVLIFPSGPMRDYLKDRDASKLKDPHRFYVAVTRARFSVAFVIK